MTRKQKKAKAVRHAKNTVAVAKKSVTMDNLPEDISKLCEMLSYRRPASNPTEDEFITKYIDSLKGIQKDKYGNRYLKVGDGARTLFTAHTDTVHNKGGMQKVSTDGHKIFTTDADSNCLGADDGLGIYIMLEMIKAKVSGVYAFFREEEIGGQGSFYAVDRYKANSPAFVFIGSIDKVVSFDRLGTNSIITHQGARCCSNVFADSLADALMDNGLVFTGDDTGTFTDSAQFDQVVPECTNLSVGYYSQHTKNEYVDFDFVRELIPALIKIDWEALMVGDKDADATADYGNTGASIYEDYYAKYGANNSSDNYGATAVNNDKHIVDELARNHPDIYMEILDNLGIKY